MPFINAGRLTKNENIFFPFKNMVTGGKGCVVACKVFRAFAGALDR
jgi:hypothetical protein